MGAFGQEPPAPSPIGRTDQPHTGRLAALGAAQCEEPQDAAPPPLPPPQGSRSLAPRPGPSGTATSPWSTLLGVGSCHRVLPALITKRFVKQYCNSIPC